MYIAVQTIGTENIMPGDPVIVKYDADFERVGAYGIDGSLYGFIPLAQPDGCVSGKSLKENIGINRIIARIITSSDSAMLLGYGNAAHAYGEYVRVEKAGYGILEPVNASRERVYAL